MKKTISLILCAVLLFGLLPATVLAEEQGGTPALPDGYEQLYALPGVGYTGERADCYSVDADTEVLFKFAAAERGETLDFTYYSVGCDAEVGTIRINQDGRYAIYRSASSAASGYIYAVSINDAGIKFALPVTVVGGNQGGGQPPQGNTPALPAGHQQLYLKGSNGSAATSFQANANDGYPLSIYIDEACENAVPENAQVSLIGHALGTASWNSNDGKWIWNTRTAIPGESGFLTAKVDDTSYSLFVKVNKAHFGVYTAPAINENSPAENYVPQMNDKDDKHEVNYTETGRTVYVIPGGNFSITKAEVTMNGDKVSATLNQSGTLEVSVANDFTGTVTGVIQITFGNNYTRNIRINFTDGQQGGTNPPPGGGNPGGNNPPQGSDPANGPFALYDARGNEIPANAGSYLIQYTKGETATCSFRTTGDAVFANGSSVAALSGPPVISGSLSDGNKTFTLSLAQVDSSEVGAMVTLKIAGGETYDARVFFRLMNNNSGGGPQLGAVISNERPAVESDYVEVGDVFSEPFQIDFGNGPQDVYMAVSRVLDSPDTVPSPLGTMSPVLAEGETVVQYRDVTFFLKEGDGYMRIDNEASLEKIGAAFVPNSLTWSIHAPKSSKDPVKLMPKVNEYFAGSYPFGGVLLTLRWENYGRMVLRVSGTLKEGNKPIQADFTYNWMPREERFFTPTGNDVIGEINAYLRDENNEDNPNVIYIINIPEGEFTGHIEIPERFDSSTIWFEGSNVDHVDSGNVPNTTTIIGGAEANGFIAGFFNIDFMGAGRDQTAWPETEIPNQAIYGSGSVRVSGCKFEGYDIALCTQGMDGYKDANASVFVNNEIAVCVNSEAANGAFGTAAYFPRNDYKQNGIAIYMKAMHKDSPNEDFTSSSFIDNEIDIKNDLKKNIFMPGCYFGETVNGNATARACNAKSPDPGGVGKKQVLVYPQAATPERNDRSNFMEFIYETSHSVYSGYGKKGPMISKNFAVTYPIPEGALAGSTFRIMDPDTLKVIKFTFPSLPEN